MDILITGGTGFVGSHLANKLSEEHEVTVGGLDPENSVISLPHSVERIKLDVTDSSTLDFSDYDCVIHLVALSPLKKPPIPYQKIHVEGTRNVIEEAENSDVERYFHMSALGADKKADTEYLRTKAEAEEIVTESDLDWRIFRPSVIFGEGGQFLDFISGLTTPYISFMPRKNTQFQPIYVEDMADLIIESLDPKYAGEIFELGGPEKVPLVRIAEKIEQSKDRSLKVFKVPDFMFKLGMMVSEHVGFSPFGMDQYRSLQRDNVVEENDIEKFGKNISELTGLDEYLGKDFNAD